MLPHLTGTWLARAPAPPRWESWGGAAVPGTQSQRGTKEPKQHGPKDKNSNRFSAKEQSHSHFPGIGRKGFGSLQTREKAITAFQTVLQEEDKGASSFKRRITRNRASGYVTSNPK